MVAAVGLLLPFAVSYLSVFLMLRSVVIGPRFTEILLCSILAIGLTLGASSCTFFLWIVFFGEPNENFVLIESLAFSLLGAILLYRFSRIGERKKIEDLNSRTPYLRLKWGLMIFLLFALVTRMIRFVILSLNNPLGDVDAFATWNLRAHFLFSGGSQWQESFSYLLSRSAQPDYPLLLPATVARLWSYWGEADILVPAGVAFLFTFSIVGVAMATLTILRGRSQGLLAALVLVGTAYLIELGSWQYADVPLAFYILATLSLFSLQDRAFENNNKYHVLILAGTMAGFAAWTKNEGAVFIVAIILSRLAAIVPNHGWNKYFEQMWAFFKGLLPVLALLAFYKLQIAPGTTLALSQGVSSMLDKVQEPSRLIEVGEALGRKVFHFGHPGLIILLLYLVLLGTQEGKKTTISAVTISCVLSLMLMVYLLMFITTPFGTDYMLATTFDRQWLQLWPSMILLLFLMVNTPEEALSVKAT